MYVQPISEESSLIFVQNHEFNETFRLANCACPDGATALGYPHCWG